MLDHITVRTIVLTMLALIASWYRRPERARRRAT